MKSSIKGMTLVELMIVIAIAAILLTVAAPSFKELILRSNIEALQDQFALSVITARTEAANRGVTVRLCAKPIPTTADGACTQTDWATNGWSAFYIDEDDTVIGLADFENKPNFPLSVRAEDSTLATEIAFNSQGYNTQRTRFIFAVCDKLPTPTYARGVTVELSGRTSITENTGNIHSAKLHNAGDNGTADAASTLALNCAPN